MNRRFAVTMVLVLGGLLTAGGSAPLIAQGTGPVAGKLIADAPSAKQIEPMVAPVARAKPITPAPIGNKAKAVQRTTKAKAATAPVGAKVRSNKATPIVAVASTPSQKALGAAVRKAPASSAKSGPKSPALAKAVAGKTVPIVKAKVGASAKIESAASCPAHQKYDAARRICAPVAATSSHKTRAASR